MAGAVLLILALYFISLPLLQGMKKRLPWFSIKLMKSLYWYHMLFAVVYYVFALYAPSDSVAYYERPQTEYDNWLDIYDTGTPFIDFVSYPFINYLGFSYEMMMVLFAWLGYQGFVYFYVFFMENTRHQHYFLGFDLVKLAIFLPNMHYWTVSLGKGSIIFWGIGLTIYGLSRLNSRKLALIAGLAIVYHVRPHVFLVICLAILIGLFTGRQKVPWYQKLLVVAGGAVALALLYQKIIAFANLDSNNLLESFEQLSDHKSLELAKSGSGIDISGYPLILKLFTFWYRPLFIDAPGPAGLIVSFENLLYLFLTLKLFQSGFIRFLRRGSTLVKTSLIIFLAISLAMSVTLSNLGIIIRQKSMVMYFFLFIIIAFLDYKKKQRLLKKQRALERKMFIPLPAN